MKLTMQEHAKKSNRTGNKKYVLMMGMALLLFAGNIQAQSIAQLTTQIVLDTEKLSELKSVLQDMYKAYTVLDQGYTGIKNIVSGNFNLHKAFLDGLLAVSPAVQHYEKVADIINAQEQLVKEYKSANDQFKAGNAFTEQEMNYIGTVYGNLFNQSLKNLDELTMVLTANQLRMSDAERLSAIDRIDRDMQDKLAFLRFFNNNTSIQALQRTRAQNDLGTVRSLYGINK